jgi:tetratricopeptide (TPR) repeat protein
MKALVALDRDELSPAVDLASFFYSDHNFVAATRNWGELAEMTREERADFLPVVLAFWSASARQAGAEQQYREAEALLEKIALGDGSWFNISVEVYWRVGDYERQYEYARRNLLLLPSESGAWFQQLSTFGVAAQLTGRWKQAAAAKEVHAAVAGSYSQMNPAAFLTVRSEVEYNLAMAAFENGDEAEGRKRLKRSAELGGQLGFFANEPLWELRKKGLFEEIDRIWPDLVSVYHRALEAYPDSHNTLNTAAWSAARAGKEIAQAGEWVDQALTLYPESAAYLDTKAEVLFARKMREEALAWSQKACKRSSDGDELGQLRVQTVHFREDDFHVKDAETE